MTDKSINASQGQETAHCGLFHRRCTVDLCNATPYPEDCQYLQANNAGPSGINSQGSLKTGGGTK